MIRYEDIEEKLLKSYPGGDVSLLQRAYIFSAKVHADQRRKSGEPYLSHPLEVANILADMGLDAVAVSVGLLHDVIEDTYADLDSLREYFGDNVAAIVDGVTKISQIPFTSTEHRQAENFRKLLLAMSNDVRVILVKLADRLHNMRTLRALSSEQKERISRETLDIYVPIANRLGIGKIKGELEDLAFFYLEPDKYQEIVALVEKHRAVGEKQLREVKDKLARILAEHEIPVEFQSRIKRVSSISAKIKRQKITFDQVYDFLALRTVTDTVSNCYTILGTVHNTWKLVPGRFKDFIGLPRANGYQSVHTTIMTDTGQPVEIQIRTREMHRMAEEGIAAHWLYKEGKFNQEDTDQRFQWLRHLLEWQKEVQDPHEFISNLKIDLYPDEVYTFTPLGRVIILPKNATAVDFAYEIHTDIGHRCVGAKVNKRLVPLKTPLRNGDIVEIITAKDHHPSRDWLSFVKTSRARSKIRQWLNKNEKIQSIELGRKILEKEALRFKISLKNVLGHADLERQLMDQGVHRAEELFSQIGFGKVSARRFLENLLQVAPQPDEAKEAPSALKSFVQDVLHIGSNKLLVDGMSDILITRAKCCSPIPGEGVVGYISMGRGIIVHSQKCRNLEDTLINPEKRIEVTWSKAQKGETYPVSLLIYTDDRKGMIADISNKITKMDVNIRDFRAHATGNRQGVFKVVLDVQDLQQLDKIVRVIRAIKNVREVERLDKKQ